VEALHDRDLLGEVRTAEWDWTDRSRLWAGTWGGVGSCPKPASGPPNPEEGPNAQGKRKPIPLEEDDALPNEMRVSCGALLSLPQT